MIKFSTTWKSSNKPKKQRKYRTNAPLHIKGKFLHAHLSEQLSKRYGRRTIRVRKGDKVKIMTGQFKEKSGKVEQVMTKEGKLFVTGIEIQKKDGTKTKYPIAASNVMITDLDLNDKKRQEKLKRKA